MKKILSLLLVALMAIGVNAGNGNKTVTGGPYKVGDYYNDGTKEGIVFVVYNGGYHGKIVSVDESYEQWAIPGADEIRTNATSDNGGMSNMRKIMKQPNWKKNYPAFAWCASLGSGWYLPALDELLLIYNNKSVINKTLDRIGYGEIKKGYVDFWSSTECNAWSAYDISMSNGNNSNGVKYISAYVRAVAAF